MQIEEDAELFASSGQSNMTLEGEVAYTASMLWFKKNQENHNLSYAIELADATMRACGDFIHAAVGPVAAQALLQQKANEKWLAMTAARKNRTEREHIKAWGGVTE